MKRIILAMMLLLGIGVAQQVEARGVIVYGAGPTTSQIKELPSEVKINDQHVNLGVVYDQFSLFWIPLWNYGEVNFAFVNDKEDTYWEVDESDLEYLKTEFNVEVPQEASIPFWTQVGGKPIVVILILFLLYGFFSKKEEEPEPTTEEDK